MVTKYSKIFSKTSRNVSSEEPSANARLLTQGGFISQEMAGVYTFLHLGLRVIQKIEKIVREEMNSIDSIEILMPTLTSQSKWETTGRLESVDVLFKAVGANSVSVDRNNAEYIVNPSHEEVVTPLVQNFTKSYKDFPISTYQIQTKFRNEARAKSGILRGREFRMKDMYSFHNNKQDFNEYYLKVKEAYIKVFERLGLGKLTKYTYASGGDFSDEYSNEFQTLTEVGEDTIFICSKCDVAYNKEIYTEKFVCLECNNTNFIEKNACEVGNIFTLGNKYTKAFNFKYTDRDNTLKDIYMGCYGIGISRVMGVIVETNNDENGIIWPESIAPYDIHIISIGEDSAVLEKTKEIINKYSLEGKDILWDDREGLSTGIKLKDADLIGCPLRIIVSNKTIESGKLEIKYRSKNESELITI